METEPWTITQQSCSSFQQCITIVTDRHTRTHLKIHLPLLLPLQLARLSAALPKQVSIHSAAILFKWCIAVTSSSSAEKCTIWCTRAVPPPDFWRQPIDHKEGRGRCTQPPLWQPRGCAHTPWSGQRGSPPHSPPGRMQYNACLRA